jgi:5-methylcytosine-specific restriction endonuclease McrA
MKSVMLMCSRRGANSATKDTRKDMNLFPAGGTIGNFGTPSTAPARGRKISFVGSSNFAGFPYNFMPAHHCTPHTPETRAKMRASHLGVPCPHKRRPFIVTDGVTMWRCGRCFKFFPEDGFYRSKRRSIPPIKSECRACHCRTSIKSRNLHTYRHQKRIDEANRRAKTKSRVSSADYRALAEILGNLCLKCGRGDLLQWDHVLPLSKTGLHHPTNLQRLCATCNVRKQASCVDYRTDAQVRIIKRRWRGEFKNLEVAK